jgi:phospho-N-acetylmuramoyl-pentapeptide-transferase
MGGLFVVAAILVTLSSLGNWSSGLLAAVAMLLLGMTVVGACDDIAKMRRGRGLRVLPKLVAQLIVSVAAVSAVYLAQRDVPGSLAFLLPGMSPVSLGWWFIPVGTFVVVGSSNAVNLTDGLDGLAGGCLALAIAAIGVVTCVAADANLAARLGVVYVPGAKNALVVAGAALGALLGFLWYNRHPARVFLGDTGSLPLGGLLGLLAVIARQELLLVVVAGVFVAEAVSVILQVSYYKWRRRRIFLCAPLHHHFQFLGWPETRIVRRFWIAAALCAVAGLGTLYV